jgi:hypothetical protein
MSMWLWVGGQECWCYEHGLLLSPALQVASEPLPAGLTGRALQPIAARVSISLLVGPANVRLSDWDHVVGFDPLGSSFAFSRVQRLIFSTVPIYGGVELCANKHNSSLLAQLARPAEEPQPAATPVSYAAALAAVPTAAAQPPSTTATGGVFVLHSTAQPAPAAAATPTAAHPPVPPAVVIKDVGTMPYINGRILQGHPPYKNGQVVKLHLDTGAGMSCVRHDAVDRLMPQLAAKGGARVRLVHPVAIHVVGKDVTFAHEIVVVGAQILVGKALSAHQESPGPEHARCATHACGPDAGDGLYSPAQHVP